MKLNRFNTICLTAIILAGFASTGQCAAVGEHEDGQRSEVYIVKKGDTLYSIASASGLNYHELAKLNDIQNPGSISIGQEIRLSHIPQKADSGKNPAKTKKLIQTQSIAEHWEAIQKAILPRILVSLCEEFKRDYPDAKYTPEVKATLTGAQKALSSQMTAELTDETIEVMAGEISVHDNLVKALRGDKDAAYQIALMYQDGNNEPLVKTRRTEQWLKFSAELGNNVASWQLADLYLSTGQQADAAKYQKRAIDLGFVPPARLSNRGY